MTGAEDIVFEMIGNAHMNCYQDLQLAIEIAHEHLPVQLSMKTLTEEVVFKSTAKKASASVSRALARAVEDIWNYGRREILQSKYGFRNKPTPKALIYRLAKALQTPAKYRILQDATGKYGIVAINAAEKHWMGIAPFLKDEGKANAIVSILNQSEVPMEQFRELAFNDELLSLIEGKPDA